MLTSLENIQKRKHFSCLPSPLLFGEGSYTVVQADLNQNKSSAWD